MLDFYDAGLLRQVATNLFYGWGYNFYKLENQLRADDLLVRSRSGLLLNRAATAVAELESAFRRTHLPAPTRAQPFPDATAVAGAQSLERLHGALVALAGRLHSAPAPATDRILQRHRSEEATLAKLLERDTALVGRCDLLRSLVEGSSAEAVLSRMAEVEAGLAAVQAALNQREQLLVALPG